MTRFTSRLTYANVVASLALFIALGGGAYAATKLPKNSVGNVQLKDDAVDGSKVDDGSLTLKDFKKNAIHNGAQGPVGPQGATGPQGGQGDRGDKGDKGDAGPGAIAMTATAPRSSTDPPPATTVLTAGGVRFYMKCTYDTGSIGSTRDPTKHVDPLVVVGLEPETAGTKIYFDGYQGSTHLYAHDAVGKYANGTGTGGGFQGVVRADGGPVMTVQLHGENLGDTCSATGQLTPSQ